MAQGYVCANCGWQEVEHRHSAQALGLEVEQIEERFVPQSGFKFVLYADPADTKNVGCPRYRPGPEECKQQRVNPGDFKKPENETINETLASW